MMKNYNFYKQKEKEKKKKKKKKAIKLDQRDTWTSLVKNIKPETGPNPTDSTFTSGLEQTHC